MGRLRLALGLLTGCSLSLCVGQDLACRLGEQCVPTDKCPDYLVRRKQLDTYSKAGAQYHLLLGQLRSQICNNPQRKVCCAQPSQPSQPTGCGLQQLTTGFVRLHNIQSWLTIFLTSLL